jgi:hypothetical protein
MDGILGNRFYQNREEPAWHRKGHNFSRPITAPEALTVVGDYNTRLIPLMIDFGDGQGLRETGYYQVAREPVPEDRFWRTFGGPVSDKFEHITPRDSVDAWHRAVRDLKGNPVPVETFGVIENGGRIFMSTSLPKFNVVNPKGKKDPVIPYLTFDNPLGPGVAQGVYVTPVRVVCQNTLAMAIAQAVQSKRIDHTRGALKHLEAWLRTIYVNALQASVLAEQALNELAKKPISSVQINWIINKTYPAPKPPSESSKSRLPFAERMEQYEKFKDLNDRRRSLVREIYDGLGVGMDDLPYNGYRAFNAIGEFETYRRGDADKTALSVVSGERSNRIKRGYAAILEA